MRASRENRPEPWHLLAGGLLGAVLIAVGAQIRVPLGPIPLTLQTLAVVWIGLVGGVRIGAIAGLAYLLFVLAGLPVLSGFNTAPTTAFIELESAGYVLGFIPAAALAGAIGKGRGFLRMVLAGLVAHGVVLALGVPVLAGWIGWVPALEHGLLPVLPGALLKAPAAAGCVELGGRLRSHRRA